MIIPKYWAEGRIQKRAGKRQITMRRFGWSDTSQVDAKEHADLRAREAWAKVAAGERLPRRELKKAYSGSPGVPIREEILGVHGEAVITRNVYGASCLNTPNVLFADIDYKEGPSAFLMFVMFGICMMVAVATGLHYHLKKAPMIGVGVILSMIFGLKLAQLVFRLQNHLSGGPEAGSMLVIQRFLKTHQAWHMRIYRTPAGLRILVMHELFKPADPATQEFFQAVGADPLYVRLCLSQNCFRARISPKPWRIGMETRINFRPGVGSIGMERMQQRIKWITEYNEASRHYAACQFVKIVGDGPVHPATEALRRLHDEWCRALTPLPIA